jgi:membrane protease subunit (stomatin/prohibitin family)
MMFPKPLSKKAQKLAAAGKQAEPEVQQLTCTECAAPFIVQLPIRKAPVCPECGTEFRKVSAS